jgi:hypothetical protein
MSVNNDTVLVVNVAESLHVTVSHEFLHLCHKLSSRVLDRVNCILCYRGISYALEEFNTLFSF